jgi:hypothetical protein
MLLCNDANSLLIVTLYRRCTIKLEIDASEESHPLLHLRGCEGEREQFGLCSRLRDCALYSRFPVNYKSSKFERVSLRAPLSLRLVSVRGVRGSEEERIAVRWVVGEILSYALRAGGGFKSEILRAKKVAPGLTDF